MTESEEKGTAAENSPSEADGERRKSRIFRFLLNWMSLIGIVIMVVGFVAIILTLIKDFLTINPPAYTGILYLFYLLFILIGFTIIPIGMLRERRRTKPGGSFGITGDLVIDLRKASHRMTLLTFLVVGLILSLGVAFGSYQTYQATESNEFCGQVCHTVMKPEYTTYSYSSHARVDCVECHIGSGAGWYVRSKISGMRQILAVTANTFPRPIPTPIQDLRPARETCEECHWPNKFIGYKESVRSYFLSDEENTPHKIRMLMKIGGEEHSLLTGCGNSGLSLAL